MSFRTFINAGVGGTPTWYGLIRLQTDVIDYAPQLVFIDFAVNGDGSAGGSRAEGFAPTKEALIRRIKVALPNVMIVPITFTWPNDYSEFGVGDVRITNQDEWLALATHYNLQAFNFGTYLETLMPVPYDDADVNVYYLAQGDVHPNNAGHLAAYEMIRAGLTSITPSSGAMPDYYFDDTTGDYEQEPIIRNGTDNDGETGAGWSTVGTARQSSTADDTISWTGTFCSFGFDTNNGGGAGTLAWSLDGGAYTNTNLAIQGTNIKAVTNFARGVHTVTVKVVSGTVKVNRFLAI